MPDGTPVCVRVSVCVYVCVCGRPRGRRWRLPSDDGGEGGRPELMSLVCVRARMGGEALPPPPLGSPRPPPLHCKRTGAQTRRLICAGFSNVYDAFFSFELTPFSFHFLFWSGRTRGVRVFLWALLFMLFGHTRLCGFVAYVFLYVFCEGFCPLF